jgi:hypothetical protein
VPEHLRPLAADLPRLRRLGAERFTPAIRPAWLRHLLVLGVDRIIWRVIIHQAYRSWELAGLGTRAFVVAHQETRRHGVRTAQEVALALWPFAGVALVMAVVGRVLPRLWGLLAYLVGCVLVAFVLAVVAVATERRCILPEVVRKRRGRELRREGWNTWAVDALAGEGGIALLLNLMPCLPAGDAITVTAHDPRTATVYRRWLTPISYPTWLRRPDPPWALERVPVRT